jgi:predicted nucleic acid-binding protein
VTSELTILEASAGDEQAAAQRLDAIKALPLLSISDDATKLADRLLHSGAFPVVAARDALHVAICAMNGIGYLLTWNFKHLANVFLRAKIAETCQQAGVLAPLICTPDELKEWLP